MKKSFFLRFGVKRRSKQKYAHPIRMRGKLSLIKAIKKGEIRVLPVMKFLNLFIALLFLIVIIYSVKVVIFIDITKCNYLKINELNFI